MHVQDGPSSFSSHQKYIEVISSRVDLFLGSHMESGAKQHLE